MVEAEANSPLQPCQSFNPALRVNGNEAGSSLAATPSATKEVVEGSHHWNNVAEVDGGVVQHILATAFQATETPQALSI